MLTPARSAATARPGFIRTRDGVDLFYRDWGSGPAVLFVASWSLPSDSWSYQMLALLAAGHRVVAFDRRGHGRSSDPGAATISTPSPTTSAPCSRRSTCATPCWSATRWAATRSCAT